MSDLEDALEARLRQLNRQLLREAEGKQNVGVYKAEELTARAVEEWQEVRRDRKEAAAERRRAKGLCCIYPEQVGKPGGEINGAWRAEKDGWTRVEVVMDSGAAECVCPPTMVPHFKVEDTVASRAGVYYTSANGGRICNVGQQTLPVAFENGIKCFAVFQVCDVSRPLMSVAKVCELGNRVIFGANGGLILNVATGRTTEFIKKDGVYVFAMWIPPLAEAPAAPFAGRP